MLRSSLFICLIFSTAFAFGQNKDTGKITDSLDYLPGSIGAGRLKWNVLHYDLTIEPNLIEKTINGTNIMTISDTGASLIQIDLIKPMMMDSVFVDNIKIDFDQDNKACWINVKKEWINKKTVPVIRKLRLYFHGKPPVAVNPPWNGGWVWKKDQQNNPWVSVACQGDGASIWFPCKDAQFDEPDNGCVLRIIVPDSLMGIGNGRLKQQQQMSGKRVMYSWEVKSPINSYNIIPYIGKYVHFGETYQGLKGKLNLDYWVLTDHLKKAATQFKEVPRMLKAFEFWMGPYPFYKDGYKLIEAPYLGMEHQSNIAYGNGFQNGYMGRDLSHTGQGLKWDFIIVHESGHEWFGNNITAKDMADNWIHEGFTDYSETLFMDYYFGKDSANQYLIGLQDNIQNDKPIIGNYGIREEGSSDMYYKGAALLHMIRQLINNDSLFRTVLIGLNKTFYHQTVRSAEVEKYIIKKSGKKLEKIFDQYLRTADVPELICEFGYNQLNYRWHHTVQGFDMPVKVMIDGNQPIWIYPEETTKTIEVGRNENHSIERDKNFYFRITNATPRNPTDGLRP